MPHGYNADHRRARTQRLKTGPRCARCGAKATIVHHRHIKRAGGTDDQANLEPLCASHHAEVHGQAWRGWAARD